MTNEEAIKTINNHHFLFASMPDDLLEALDMAIQALEQEPCEDAISRKRVMAEYCMREGVSKKSFVDIINDLPPVNPQPKIGHWVLTQRDKYIDISCSECGTTRFKDYACGYTIDELNLEEINDLIKKIQMNYCECCGAKMLEP